MTRWKYNLVVLLSSSILVPLFNKRIDSFQADIVEQLRRQAAQNSSSSTGAQRLLRQNSNSLHRLQGPNTFSSNRTEEPGGGPPTALAKLTNRLNFLKERRAMLASEMQNLDLARPPTAPAPNKDST
ncbi:unnamed protein product [Triticum turgidum subsp. durum]|uniref:Uncharacterized protein n=1 Tax=Triticum turgidum subsp. durum TaxID=4567 RepID=A0A9R0S578_TRITD|nr:unnamed protein product [Triticum turgidum subsp. durum]